MSEESTTQSAVGLATRLVVDTPTGTLWLKLVQQIDTNMATTFTAAVNHDVTAMLVTFDLGGRHRVKEDVDFAIRLHRLDQELHDVDGLTVWNLHASRDSSRNDEVWNARGFLVCFDEDRSDRHQLERIISEQGFCASARLRKADSGHWMTSEQQLYVVDDVTSTADPAPSHPVFAGTSCNSVFRSLQQVAHVLTQLQDCDSDPSCTELLGHLPAASRDVDVNQSEGLSPCIVVEGLDAAGKSTLVERLAKNLSARRLQSPPEAIRGLRASFDAKAPVIRRAYYYLGNYLVADLVRESLEHQPVVLDRYWHSTTAYSIAEECPEIPEEGNIVYRWPSDLFKPSLVILLVVSEEQRNARIDGRNLQLTTEERQLAQDAHKRLRTVTAYRRMMEPGIVEVSADGTADEVFELVMDLLRDKGILQRCSAATATAEAAAAIAAASGDN